MARETPEAKEFRLKTEQAARVAHKDAVRYHTAQYKFEQGKISKEQMKKIEDDYKKSAKAFNSLHEHFQNSSTTYSPNLKSKRILPTKKSINEPKSTRTKIALHPRGLKMSGKKKANLEVLVKPQSKVLSEETRKKMRIAQRKRRMREKAQGIIKKLKKR